MSDLEPEIPAIYEARIRESYAAGRLAGLREAAAACPTIMKAGERMIERGVTGRVVVGCYGDVPAAEFKRLSRLLALAEGKEG